MDLISPSMFLSEIEQERFGFKTARVVGMTSEKIASVLDFCSGEKVELLIARCGMSDLDAAQSMEKNGFLLMDTLVCYCIDLVGKAIPPETGSVVVRPVRADEEKEIIAVAEESFRGYFGHYHADPLLDNARCDEAYTDWARKAFASRQEDNFLAGEMNGKVVAFGVLRMNDPDEGEMFLGGIHPDFQGQGIYQSFLYKAMQWCLARNARKMIISTQLQNISVQKVLIKLGFEISGGSYTYHKWFV